MDQKERAQALNMALEFLTKYGGNFDGNPHIPVINFLAEQDALKNFKHEDIERWLNGADKDRLVFDACLHIAAYSIKQELNIHHHPKMRSFISDYLFGNKIRPAKRGLHKDYFRNRNSTVTACIWLLTSRFEIKATRSDASEHINSACDIVSEAMIQLGHKKMSYQAIKRDIWEKRIK